MTAPVPLRIEAEPGAGLLCRLVGLIAQHDLDVAWMDVRPARAGRSSIRIALAGLDAHGAEIVAEKMARVIGVVAVAREDAGAQAPTRRAA